jgi:hypothetical protein
MQLCHFYIKINLFPHCMKHLTNSNLLITCGSVGIATAYSLDDPGIETRWGLNFPHLSVTTLRPTQPTVQWVPGLSRG